MLEYKLTRRQLGLAAQVLSIIGIVLLIWIWLTWPSSRHFLDGYEPMLKLIGYVVGPLFALIGLFATRLDKIELGEGRQEIGRLSEKVKSEEQRVLDKEKAVNAALAQVDTYAQVVQEREERIVKLEVDLVNVTRASNLWRIRQPRPFPEYDTWKHQKDGAKIITVGLFKGGVGKTHLCANLAAYLSEQHKKPVLLIDLDYQGSLSSTILRSADHDPVGSRVDRLFFDDCAPLEAFKQSVGLSPTLKSASIVPADYTLEDIENRLVFGWIIDKVEKTDPMFRLARILLDPQVRSQFAAIIIDTPPRMTMGTINAFVASHFFVIPILLDRVSSEALRPFLKTVKLMSKDLDLQIKLAGIVASMTRQSTLVKNEPGIWEQIRQTATEELDLARDPRISQHIPRKAVISNDDTPDLAYFLTPANERPLKEVYDLVFDELWGRIVADSSAAL